MSSSLEHLAGRRRLGLTGLHLPPFGLGGAALGNLHGAITDTTAAGMLAESWEAGLRYYDTAPLYGRGLGELRVGSALRRHARPDYLLSTKVGWRMLPLEGRLDAAQPTHALPFALRTDYSREGTFRSVEDSLMRLGVDRLDAVFVHDVDPYNHGDDGYALRFREVLQGALPALHELRRAGRVGAVGVAVNSCAVCLDFIAEAEVDAFLLAGRYTLLDQSAAAELLPACLARGIGVIVGAPFNSGVLASGAQHASRFNYQAADTAIVRRVEALEQHCRAHGVSLMAAALRFPLRHPAVASVLPGPRSAEQLNGVIAAAREEVPAALWRELSDAGLILPGAADAASSLT